MAFANAGVFDEFSNNSEDVFERELLKIPNQGEIALDWIKTQPKQALKKAIMIIFPGFMSTSKQAYVKKIAL